MSQGIYMCDGGFDQNGLALIEYSNNGGMYYVDSNLNVVSSKLKSGENIGRNVYALETTDGIAGYFQYNGKELVQKTNGFNHKFTFHNGTSLFRDFDNKRCFFVNSLNEIISSEYKNINLFSDDGVASVVDLENNAFMINENFEQISPVFSEIREPDKEGVIIARTDYAGYSCYEYYQFDGEKFVCVSPEYSSATYFNGDFAIVQDINSQKYYAVDKDFIRVSKFYDNMIGVYGNPGVIVVKEEGKQKILSQETFSEIQDVDRYWEMSKMLEHDGYSPLLEAFEGYLDAGDIENQSVMQDLKVVVKDYLVKNSYRMGYDDVSKTFYVKLNKNAKQDSRVDLDKLYLWIKKVVKDVPSRAEELYMLSQGKILG